MQDQTVLDLSHKGVEDILAALNTAGVEVRYNETDGDTSIDVWLTDVEATTGPAVILSWRGDTGEGWTLREWADGDTTGQPARRLPITDGSLANVARDVAVILSDDEPVPTDQSAAAETVMADGIEYALWEDLAGALNRIEDWGLDPIAGLCEQLGIKPTTVIDAGPVIHGGGDRVGGYLLRIDDGSAWTVAPRAGLAAKQVHAEELAADQGAAPTEPRRLLAEVSRWRKANGWSDSSRGWINEQSVDDAAVAVKPDPDLANAFTVTWRKGNGGWHQPDLYMAVDVQQAVEMLVALGILPARFSSAYRAGWLNGYAEAATNNMPTPLPTNPDRRCRTCGATSGLILLPGNPLTGAGRGHECADGCKAATR